MPFSACSRLQLPKCFVPAHILSSVCFPRGLTGIVVDGRYPRRLIGQWKRIYFCRIWSLGLGSNPRAVVKPFRHPNSEKGEKRESGKSIFSERGRDFRFLLFALYYFQFVPLKSLPLWDGHRPNPWVGACPAERWTERVETSRMLPGLHCPPSSHLVWKPHAHRDLDIGVRERAALRPRRVGQGVSQLPAVGRHLQEASPAVTP